MWSDVVFSGPRRQFSPPELRPGYLGRAGPIYLGPFTREINPRWLRLPTGLWRAACPEPAGLHPGDNAVQHCIHHTALYYAALYTLHCTALYCAALYTLHCTVLRSTVFRPYCSALWSTVYTTLHCIVQHCIRHTAPYCWALYIQHCTVLCRTAYITIHYVVQHGAMGKLDKKSTKYFFAVENQNEKKKVFKQTYM